MRYIPLILFSLLSCMNNYTRPHYLQTLDLSSKLILSAGTLWTLYGCMDSIINKKIIKHKYSEIMSDTSWQHGQRAINWWKKDLVVNKIATPISLTAIAILLKRVFDY